MSSCWEIDKRECRRGRDLARIVIQSVGLLLGMAPVAAVASPLGIMGSHSEGSVQITVTVRPVFNVVARPLSLGGMGYCMSSNMKSTGLPPRFRPDMPKDQGSELSRPSDVELPWCNGAPRMVEATALRDAKVILVEAQ